MTDEQKIVWAAGFFDGEGTVAICRQNHKRFRPSYVLIAAITQKDPLPLRFYQELFGGLLYAYKLRGIEYWRWCVNGNGALRALRVILPFLILKRERADIGVDFQEKLVVWNRDYGRRGYPEHVVKAREEYHERMRVLNQRGVSDAKPNPKPPGPRNGNGRNRFTVNRKFEEKDIQTIQ